MLGGFFRALEAGLFEFLPERRGQPYLTAMMMCDAGAIGAVFARRQDAEALIFALPAPGRASGDAGGPAQRLEAIQQPVLAVFNLGGDGTGTGIRLHGRRRKQMAERVLSAADRRA